MMISVIVSVERVRFIRFFLVRRMGVVLIVVLC